ncbi:MAG: YceI family protein [Chitinophagales bacterium]
MKQLYIATALVLFSTYLFAQTKWTIDPAHTSIKFEVSHMGINTTEGKFTSFNGTMTATNPDFSDAQVEFAVDLSSINTDNQMRDNHLKSDDFFNAEKYPQMIFKSTSFKKVSDKKYQLSGNLTIRDKTRPVTFDVTYGGMAADSYGNTHAGFKAATTINRLDYDLKWNKMIETGAVVGSDVDIIINGEFLKAK